MALPDVGAMEVGAFGEFFLGQAAVLAEFADSEADVFHNVTHGAHSISGIIGNATDKSTTDR
jgi:hypothetical protein